ncbi:MAG: cupin domain-containing protein [Bryobacterales bacterium]|nr:cupin domain-containing protein [Bryobacterales bacterium]
MRLLATMLLSCAAALTAATSTTLVDNDRVEIVRVVAEAAHATGDHEHKVNRVMIYLDAGGQVTTYKVDARKVAQKWAAGEPLWSPAEGLHRVVYETTTPVELVKVELQQAGPLGSPAPGPLDPVKVWPQGYLVEIDNPQVRVIRVKAGPGETIPLHEHVRPRAVVYLTDADFEQMLADGGTVESRHKRGDVVWSEGQVRHSERNRGGAFEALVVELK